VEREGAGINDALRYTIILPPGPEYGNLFAMISDLMKFWNITTNVRKDYWVKSETYHGVNMTFKTPETRTVLRSGSRSNCILRIRSP
jgi:hypothetical protein